MHDGFGHYVMAVSVFSANNPLHALVENRPNIPGH
jgi:hypothetical protein